MVFITDTQFIEALNYYLATVIKDAHLYTSQQTIIQRLLSKCANILEINLNWQPDKNNIYIHPDNMIKIDRKWQSLIENGVKLLHDEENVYKLIKYSDFVNIHDMQKFINILINKKEEDFLLELFAVDGFQGLTNIKNYIFNLKIGSKGRNHIQVIRNIYTTFQGSPVKIIHLTLLKIYLSFAKDDEMQQLITNTIDELENEICKVEKIFLKSDVDKIKNMYLTSVEDLETIALIKMVQLKLQKKKNKGVKRKNITIENQKSIKKIANYNHEMKKV